MRTDWRRLARYFAAATVATLAAAPVHAQGTPFGQPAPVGEYRVTLIDLDARVAAPLARTYTDDGTREHLWCVTRYEVEERETYTLVHVRAVREEDRPATRSRVAMAPGVCVERGHALPTIHSHPGGTCQASPEDARAYLARMAPFDGILCAPTSHVWYFAPEMAAALETHIRDAADAAQRDRHDPHAATP